MGSKLYTGVKTSVKCFVLLVIMVVSAGASAQLTGVHSLPVQSSHAHRAIPVGPVPGYQFPDINNPGVSRSLACDSPFALDYSFYNSVYDSTVPYLTFNQIYVQEVTSYTDTFHKYESNYANQFFDSLTYVSNQYALSSLALSASTVSMQSVSLFAAIYGDTSAITAADSLVFTLYTITGSGPWTAPTPVQTVVLHGKPQLEQFLTGQGYIRYATVPFIHQFTQGQAFGIGVKFQDKDTAIHFTLGFTFQDSCGPSYAAYKPEFPYYASGGQIQPTGVGAQTTVAYYDNTYQYGLGVSTSCEFIFPQNWYIVPNLSVCQSSVQPAPVVVTKGATAITTSSATLNGTINNNNNTSTTSGFQWGTTIAYSGGTIAGTPLTVTGSVNTSVSAALSGLTASTTYHYRAVGTAGGTAYYGRDTTFTTLASVASSCDTLFNMISATDTPFIYYAYPSLDSGFVAGNNFYGDLIKAEGFPSVVGDHVTSAVLEFAIAKIKSTDSSNTVKIIIYDNTGISLQGSAGAPGNALDSATISLRNIAYALGGGYANLVNFTGLVALTTDTFYVGVVLPTVTGDTLALAMDGGRDGDGWEYNPAYGGWGSYVNDWGFNLHAGNYVEAIICSPQQVNSPCTPAAGAPPGLSPDTKLVPCVTQGTSFSQTYTFVVPSTVVVQGNTLTVTSITIDSVGNLPAGLTWTPSVNPATYNPGNPGCYIISGISSAACGEYLTPIYVMATTNLGTFPVTLNQAGVPNQFLQVITTPHGCPAVDTTQTTPFVANPTCGVSVAPSVTITPTEISCFGQTTGAAVAIATGGNGTYTYLWSTGATTSSISNLAAQTYTVTVTSNGQTATATTTITQPASALTVAPTSTLTSCTGNTGTALANANGGTPAYLYNWSNGSTTASLAGLAANTYHVTVTDSKGCTATGTTTVSTPGLFNISTSVTNVNCFGQATGSITATAIGTSGTLTYGWSNNTTAQTAGSLVAGTYTVTITETNGCSSTASATVSQPVSALGASATATTTSCISNTGSATVTATGGTTGYTYSWSPSGSTATISNIGVGVYDVTVTDAKGCTATATASVNTSATYTVNVTSTNVNCFGGSTGTAQTTVTGANGTVTYAWSNGGTTQSIASLSANTYNVTVKDGSGCAKTGSTTVTQPASAVSASVTTTQTACSSNTGTATATGAGGTAGYTYLWSNSSTANPVSGLGAVTVNVTVTDSKGCTATSSGSVSVPAAFQVSATATPVACNGQNTGGVSTNVTGSSNDTYFWNNGDNTANISNVNAGTYTVTVTDGFGCTATASATVTQPASGVTATTSTTPQSSCLTDNGTATVNASNGASPYTYLWNNSQGTSTISNLAAGNYTVTVTDNNHCTASAVASVNSPASFTIAVTTTNVTCFGAATGSAMVTVTGTGNYTYLWSNSVTSANNANVQAGTYNVTVTDANGCEKVSSGVITQPATALVANATATNSTCGTASGTASVTVVGGTGSPSYVWSANANNATTSSITNLTVGVYSVTVTEGGCTATSSAIVNNLNGPTITLLPTNPTCPGGANGTIIASPSGGSVPYTYVWSTGQTTANISSLSSGTYSLILTDSSGCRAVQSVTLVSPDPIAFGAVVANELCQGNQSGSVTLSVTGGTGPYSYTWSNGNSTPAISNLSAGGITVTVTDSKQCTAQSSFTVTQPSAIQISTSTTDAANGANGTATANVTGGTSPYTYSWPGSVTSQTATGLAVGTYTVTVTDANNCTATASATIVASGINEVTASITNITLIPNPATDQVKVMVSLASAQTVEFRLVDITGKYVYTAHESAAQGNFTHQINLNEFASGIYLVEIATGNEIARRKLVITR